MYYQIYSNARFGDVIIEKNKVFPTVTWNTRFFYDKEYYVNSQSLINAASFPEDYNFLSDKEYIDPRTGPQYLLGMSVPPLMTAHIASEVFSQWLAKLGWLWQVAANVWRLYAGRLETFNY